MNSDDIRKFFLNFKNANKTHITIIGADEDNGAIEELTTLLRETGFKCWSVPTDMLPGLDVDLETWKAVYDAQIVLFCISIQIKSEGKHQKLLKLAIDAQKEISEGLIKVIPVEIQPGVRIPATFAKEHLTSTSILTENGLKRLRGAIELSQKQRPNPVQNYDVIWK